jgi:hypothetical protein
MERSLMVIMVVLLNKVVEKVKGLGHERLVAHDWYRAGAVPIRSSVVEKVITH